MANETIKGEITLPVNVARTIRDTKFHMIEGNMRFNALLERPWIHNMREVPSTLHQRMKFLTSDDVKIVEGEQHAAMEIFAVDEEKIGFQQSTNKTIIQNLKKRLSDAKGKWREVLPEVLWAYRATSKPSTGATPFSLVYGSEALIPVEVGEPSTRFWHALEESNHEAMNTTLELLDEKREVLLVWMAAQKQRIERYYN
ncbi:uncharacterized protein [Nicotiana sylvestris]|uniref:uncharacterized protein n=1 Tax=Nicotiana sylvestris TaxID=4096 RepID=UPI00388C527A